ncbi:type VI secretion system baseplate subunit TssF [Serratia rhizosphaerae]|nr:type VI secretion system baseplate subunit TssF [Serratia rhizosphaerae]
MDDLTLRYFDAEMRYLRDAASTVCQYRTMRDR